MTEEQTSQQSTQQNSTGRRSENIRKVLEYLKQHNSEAKRKDIANALGKNFGPLLYQMAKKGKVERVKKDDGVWFKLV